jgi:ribonuclease HI
MYLAYFDGSSKPVQQKSRIGFIIYTEDGKEVYKESKEIQYASSQKAERCALVSLLNKIIELGIHNDPVIVYGDCKSIIDIVNEEHKIKERHKKTYNMIHGLLNHIPNCKIEWVDRKKNNIADKLARIPKETKRDLKRKRKLMRYIGQSSPLYYECSICKTAKYYTEFERDWRTNQLSKKCTSCLSKQKVKKVLNKIKYQSKRALSKLIAKKNRRLGKRMFF